MRKYLIVGLLMLVLLVSIQSVFAFNTDQNPGNPYDKNKVDTNMSNISHKVWNTVANLVRIASVACILFAGLRYMFASADQKADIKKGLIYLAIGAVLIFGATTVIEFVVEMFNEAV